MLKGYFVMQDEDNYIVLKFLDPDYKLPKPYQQRSVLIKNITLPIEEKVIIPKATWTKDHKTAGEYNAICNFITNRNNHTASSWNNIRNTSSTKYIDRKKVIKVKEIWKDVKRLRRSVSNFKYGKS